MDTKNGGKLASGVRSRGHPNPRCTERRIAACGREKSQKQRQVERTCGLRNAGLDSAAERPRRRKPALYRGEGQTLTLFKCSIDFSNPAPSQEKEMKECAAQIANEKPTHELLMKHPHPNIVRCILCVPEGFFMERMEGTLQTRLDQDYAPSNRTKARWITQTASALSWIEGLGFVHGDLRPANILLTADDNIRLADFDVSVKIGEQLEAASEPFFRLNEGLELPHAEPITEQFALGHASTRFVSATFHLTGLTPPCWWGQYASVSAAYDDIKARCDGLGYDTESVSDVSEDLVNDMPSLFAECKDFIAREKVKVPPVRAQITSPGDVPP
ncbi:hypothetical protein E4U44_008536 [Claviceps purpurea]|nr:hypothetical protein E4U44_008536 [Claviceps purpurea]